MVVNPRHQTISPASRSRDISQIECRLASAVRGVGKCASEGGIGWFRFAPLGWVSPSTRRELLLCWSQQPEDGRTKRRHYPNVDRPEMFEKGYVAAKSGHTRGSTVDLTLYHLATGELAPMGGGHDLMDPISHHGAKGITQVETGNRQYLCSIMEDSGFSSHDCEWWHYTLKHEPYPNTYFDFPIT
jgi:D-alanyl-D-alanine dipeptidase